MARSDEDLLSRYERFAEAENLGEATSMGGGRAGRRADKLLARINERGLDTSGLDINQFEGTFDQTSAEPAASLLTRMRRRRTPEGENADRAANRYSSRLRKQISDVVAERQLAENEAKFAEQDENVFGPGQERLNEMARTNAITGEQEQFLRSKIAGMNRSAAASNLSRVSSSLGLRGMQDSPAAAAIASSVAEGYDRDLSNQLSEMGFQVDEMNRDQTRKDTGAAVALANLRNASEQAYIGNDRQAVMDISRDTAALLDALYTRGLTFDMYEKQLEDASKESLSDRLGTWSSLLPSMSFAGFSVDPASPATPGAEREQPDMLGGSGGTGSDPYWMSQV